VIAATFGMPLVAVAAKGSTILEALVRAVWLVGFVNLGICSDDDAFYKPFNGDDDVVELAVDPSGDLEWVSADLYSSTGTILIGTGTVTPGAAPVGTDHDVTVEVLEDFEETVERVTVEVEADDRGISEHVLRQDSADAGLWKVSITSRGEEGETRTDLLRFVLWEAAEKNDEDATEVE
jgi:hypothetical protein